MHTKCVKKLIGTIFGCAGSMGGTGATGIVGVITPGIGGAVMSGGPPGSGGAVIPGAPIAGGPPMLAPGCPGIGIPLMSGPVGRPIAFAMYCCKSSSF